jgi:hypothetical protein
MAALANEFPLVKADHYFNAEANVLHANLEKPLKEDIRPQALVKLPRDGQYQFSQAAPFRFEGILSHEGGYTQVAGYPRSKGLGSTTLATSVLEGLNVLDIVTADRVVAQISTDHPIYGEGQVPSVTFLGTRFDNLRIGGHRVDLDRNLEILGPKPENDESYFENRDVLHRISQQYDRIASSRHLPDWGRQEFPQGRPVVNGNGALKCSLINQVDGIPGTFGHVIDLPHFGKIYLGELKVIREPGDPGKGICDSYRFQLTMIKIVMGCIGAGTTNVSSADSNGQGSSGGPHK